MTLHRTVPVVLVHGAWFGSWCWDMVVTRLAALGVSATAVDLPGRPGNPLDIREVTVERWASCVRAAVDEVPDGCVVVGHSLAGAVLTSLAEADPTGIERLVYVAAFLLESGQAPVDVVRGDPYGEMRKARRLADDQRSSSLVGSSIADIVCGGSPAALVAQVGVRSVPESTRPARTAVHWTAGRYGTVPRTYVVCEQDRMISPDAQRRMVARVGCDRVETIETGHAPFYSAVNDLASILVAASGAAELAYRG